MLRRRPLLAKVQMVSPALTKSSFVVVSLVGSLVLPRSVVVIKLEDAEMRLQVAVRVLLVLRAA